MIGWNVAVYDYQHTQPGTLIRFLLGGCALAAAVTSLLISRHLPLFAPIPLAVASILGACLVLFHSLTVRVSRDQIALRFGIGLIRKRFAVADVENAAVVRNRWYYGWGIRLTPYGWLYNVSGLDAVEIELRNGRKYRIGTDQPAALLSAIESATGLTPGSEPESKKTPVVPGPGESRWR